MSLKPEGMSPVPEETARIAHAVFPKGNAFMRMRDELGTIYQDETFAHLFSHCTGRASRMGRWLVTGCLRLRAVACTRRSCQVARSVRSRRTRL